MISRTLDLGLDFSVIFAQLRHLLVPTLPFRIYFCDVQIQGFSINILVVSEANILNPDIVC